MVHCGDGCAVVVGSWTQLDQPSWTQWVPCHGPRRSPSIWNGDLVDGPFSRLHACSRSPKNGFASLREP